MPIPDFIVELRRHIGTAPLWLIGTTAVVLRPGPDGQQHVLLIRRSDTGDWAPITGIVDPGEEPGDAAVRETLEEAGVAVAVERLVWVSVTDPVRYPNGDQAQYLDHTFRCHWLGGEPTPDQVETLEAAWWPVAALPPMSAQFADRVHCALANPAHTLLGRVQTG